jgi:hypothetical protein
LELLLGRGQIGLGLGDGGAICGELRLDYIGRTVGIFNGILQFLASQLNGGLRAGRLRTTGTAWAAGTTKPTRAAARSAGTTAKSATAAAAASPAGVSLKRENALDDGRQDGEFVIGGAELLLDAL